PAGRGGGGARGAGPGAPAPPGCAQARAGGRAGRAVPGWLARPGMPPAPPLPPSQIRGWVLMMTVLAPAALALLLLAVMGIFGRLLDRRRVASWGQAWSAIGPQWTRRPR